MEGAVCFCESHIKFKHLLVTICGYLPRGQKKKVDVNCEWFVFEYLAWEYRLYNFDKVFDNLKPEK